jgi:hypothetical protein
MNRRRINRLIPFRLSAMALAAVLGFSSIATADIVIKGRAESREPGLSDRGRLRIGPIILEIVSALGGDVNAAGDAVGKPKSSVTDFTVSLKGNRMRMDVGGSSLLAGLQADGSAAEWAVLDPASGRVIQGADFDPSAGVAVAAENGGFFRSLIEGLEETKFADVTTSDKGTRQIAGHTTHGYGYGYLLAGAVPGEAPWVIGTRVDGTIWVAEDGPYIDDELLVAFFRSVGAEIISGVLVTPPAEIMALAQQRPVLAKSEELKVFLIGNESGQGTAPMQGSSSFEVKEIASGPLDAALFGGFEQAEKQCDCTCKGFKELKAIGKLSKRQQEAHPKAMALSMCTPQCMTTWFTCPPER